MKKHSSIDCLYHWTSSIRESRRYRSYDKTLKKEDIQCED